MIAKRYLILVWKDVEPVVRGPYETDEARDDRARKLWKDLQDCSIYVMDIYEDHSVMTCSYTNRFFEEEE